MHSVPAGMFPYARFIPGQKAILLITHPSDEEEAEIFTFKIEVPLAEMQMDDHPFYQLTDLWNDSTFVVSKTELAEFEIDIPADYQPGGGFRVLKIEPKME